MTNNPHFTYTFDGNEFITPPFKVIMAGKYTTGIIPDNMIGKYFYELIGMSESEATTVKNNWKWWNIRKERDGRLAKTDWTQNDDVPNSTKTKWQAYRQALRDVPSQSNPYNVTWPTEPS